MTGWPERLVHGKNAGARNAVPVLEQEVIVTEPTTQTGGCQCGGWHRVLTELWHNGDPTKRKDDNQTW